MATPVCRLCELPVSASRLLSDASNPDDVFCCGGCKNVWRILVESGTFPEGADPTQSPLFIQAKALGLIGAPAAADLDLTNALDVPVPQLENESSGLSDLRQCVLRIDGMWCASCSWLIRHVLLKHRGVASADVNFLTDTARIVYLPARTGEDDLLRAINALGYQAVSTSGSDSSDPRVRARRRDLIRSSLGFISAMNVMMGQLLYYAGFHSPQLTWLLFALTIPVIICAWPIFIRGYLAVRHGHATMETLVAIGATIATAYSVYCLVFRTGHLYFDTAAMLLGLVMVGKYLENGVRAFGFRLSGRAACPSPT